MVSMDISEPFGGAILLLHNTQTIGRLTCWVVKKKFNAQYKCNYSYFTSL